MVWAIWPLSIWSGILRKSFNLKLLHIFTFNSQLHFHFLLAFVLFHYPPLISDTNRTSRDRFLRSVSGTRTNVLKTISWAGWNEDLFNVKYLVYQCTCVWRCSLDLHDMQREVIWRKSLYFHNFFWQGNPQNLASSWRWGWKVESGSDHIRNHRWERNFYIYIIDF